MQPSYSFQGIPEPKVPAPVDTHLPCFLVEKALEAKECARLIAEACQTGFAQMATQYPPGYRNNDRLVFDDARLAAALFARLRPHLPSALRDDDGHLWSLVGLNERFRFCRYQGGQSFSLHQDGAFARGEHERSRLTCMLYLNDASEFDGGFTRYFAGGTPDARELGRVAPRTGTAIVFDHALWHDGQPVTRGTKYVMRTDVMYRRLPVSDVGSHRSPTRRIVGDWRLHETLQGHTGYVWAVRRLHDGRLASGSRDCSVRTWQRQREGWAEAGRLQEHTASVTALVEAAEGELWSGSRDGTIRSSASEGGRALGGHEGTVLALERWDKETIVSAGADSVVRIWSTQGRSLVGELRAHSGWVWSLAKTNGLLASGSEDGTIHLWDLRRRESVAEVAAGAPVRALTTFGSFLAAGLSDGRVQLWKVGADVPQPVLVREARVHRGAVTCLCPMGPDLLASGGEDSQVRLTRVGDLGEISALPQGGFVRSIVALDEGTLACGGYDGLIAIWVRPR